MNIDNLGYISTTIGGGFFVGLVIGWSLKKVIKLLAVIIGLFLGALIYLQSQNILNINWNNLQSVSQTSLSSISNTITNTGEISSIMGNIGIPLTGSVSAGFVIGFMKG